MRKAFDANVPKLKPRLRPAPAVVSNSLIATQDELTDHSFEQPAPDADVAVSVNFSPPAPADIPEHVPAADDFSAPAPDGNTQPCAAPEPAGINRIDIAAERVQQAESPSDYVIDNQPAAQDAASRQSAARLPETPVPPADDGDARRKRLDDVKRRVAEAVRPEIPVEPVPEDPALAVESVLVLVSDLEARLSRSRDLEKTLRTELTEAKAELSRTVNDGRTASGRLLLAESQLEEKRNVLQEMLLEMGALEDERDQAVRMVQMLTVKDGERRAEVDELGRRCAEMRRSLDESKVEEERLAEELDGRIAENSRLHALFAELTKERDGLARTVERLTRERDDLAEAKKALEKVHHALSQARARLRE